MYCQFFGLQKNPFSMTPDPAFLYMTPQHREALAGLTYAILGQRGFLVLTGDAGSGKTTLLARVLQHLPASRIQSSVILNPTLSAAEFLEMALLDFGVTEVPASKAQRLTKLQQLLVSADRQKKTSALIIDEAHKLTPEVLEEIRLLGNFEQSDHKLLQILFLGQDELAGVLNRPDLRQLKQRIAARFSIGPLGAEEVEGYIRHRWTKAGGADAPFTPEAIASAALYSKGIPRIINALCDNSLILAFGEGVKNVRADHVREAAEGLDFAAPISVSMGRASRPPAADPVLEARSAIPVTEAAPMPAPSTVLERYAAPRRDQSFLARWAVRLGLAD